MITEETVLKYLNRCKIEEFEVSENGEVHNEYLQDYINAFSEEIINSKTDNCQELIKYKNDYERKKSVNDLEVINACLFFNLIHSYYNIIIRKYQNTDPFLTASTLIMKYSIAIYNDILTLLLSGSSDGVLAKVRTLYENYAILRFVCKHKNTSQSFIDHAVIKQVAILNAMEAEKGNELEQKYKEIIETYKDEVGFTDNYGWTYSVITERKMRHIKTIIDDAGLSGYKGLYKITSEYIHSSAFPVIFGFSKNETFIKSFHATSIELITNAFIHFNNTINPNKKERLLIMNNIYAIREALYGN